MRPRQVADRAVEVQGGRVTLYEDGQAISTIPDNASARDRARKWLRFDDDATSFADLWRLA